MTAKVLIVDDESDLEQLVLQRFRRQIGNQEYTFLFASNGAEAIEMLQDDPEIEAIMTDIRMPVMDGLTLLDKIPEINPFLQPVIVSAYGDMANIRTAMNRGAFDFLTKPIDFGDFEITLVKSLNQARTLKRAAQAAEQLAAIRHELGIAATMQQSLLPLENPSCPGLGGFDLYAVMLPALNVGGDFYDYFLLDPDRLGIVIGDVCGKGVPAALFMAMSLTLLKAVARRKMPPGECLQEVNAILTRDNRSERFVTLFYGILDRRTGQLLFSNGGHNPPFIVPRNGEARMLDDEAGGTFLGCFEDAPYETGQTSLEAGDVLVLFTDGVPEAMDSGGNQFSNPRLQAFLKESGDRPPGEIVRGLIAAVQAFAHGAFQSDDVTILAVRYLACT